MPRNAPHTSPRPAGGLEDRLFAEQVTLLYQHGASLVFGNTLGVFSTALMLWSTIDHRRLIIWVCAVILLTAARMALIAMHRRWQTRLGPTKWGWLFVLGTTLSGVSWGILGFLPATPEPITLAAVGIVLAGLTGASVPAIGTFYPAYAFYATAALMPFTALCLAQEDQLSFGMGVVSLCYYLCALLFCRINSRFTLGSIRLRFENLDLLRQLRVQTQAAEAARAAAESANTGKTRFLAAASHDLRQPLQTLTLLTDALQTEPLSPHARRLLQSMRDACSSMGSLMNELMDYSRIDSGTLQADIRSFDLGTVLSRIETEFADEAGQRGLTLRVRPTHLRVQSDPHMIERVLRNLVSNAVKYTARGGVLLGCRRRGERVRLEVWDTGFGIPVEMQKEVFREFYQLDNPERDRKKGLGLGLAIVDGLAKLLDLRLTLRSMPGRGTVFSLELPLVEAAGRRAAPAESADHPPGTGHILVIDNEPAILHAMCSLLASWGFQPMGAESVEHALSGLKQAPDAILADYRLRNGSTGIEAIQAVRQRFDIEIPAALITGDTDPHRLAEAQLHSLRLLRKPTQSAALRALIEQLLAEGSSHDISRQALS